MSAVHKFLGRLHLSHEYPASVRSAVPTLRQLHTAVKLVSPNEVKLRR